MYEPKIQNLFLILLRRICHVCRWRILFISKRFVTYVGQEYESINGAHFWSCMQIRNTESLLKVDLSSRFTSETQVLNRVFLLQADVPSRILRNLGTEPCSLYSLFNRLGYNRIPFKLDRGIVVVLEINIPSARFSLYSCKR